MSAPSPPPLIARVRTEITQPRQRRLRGVLMSLTGEAVGVQRLNIGSRMSREAHVRYWERVGVRFPCATRPIAAWKAAPRTTPGGQPHYSDLAITTALTLRAVFRLALRQTVIGSVLQLLGLDLSVPDFSTLSRRAQSLELPAQPRAPGGPIHLLVRD